MKTILYGTETQEPQTELAAQLAQEFYNSDMLLHLVTNLQKLDFEVGLCLYEHSSQLFIPCLQAKKDVAQIFNNILRRQIGTRSPTVEYVCTKSEILAMLVKG